MKKALLVLLLTLTMLFTFGCGGDDQKDGTATDVNGANQVIIAIEPDYVTMDPGYCYEMYAPMIVNAAYDTLFRFTKEDEPPVPHLVDTYEVSPDNLVYTFELKPDIKFASGNPLTAADVKFSFDRMKYLQSNASSLATGIKSVEAKDDTTVIVTLSQPDSAFLAKTTYCSFGVLDSKVVGENGGIADETAVTADTAQQFLNGKSAGSGPYIMESYTPDVEIVLKRNENYWGTKPAVETIIIKDVPEANTQLLTLQQGDIDIAFNLNSDQISQIKDDQKLQVITTPTKTIGFLMMNMDPKIGGPMADPKVQQAVRYALDYQGLHTLIGEGTITPASIIQVGFFGALEARDPGYTNLDKAKALLKEAGYESGFTIDMPVCTLAPEGIPLPTIAQKVKEDLSKVNITVNIQTSDWAGGYGDEYRNGTLPFTAMYWAPDYNDPNTQLDFLPGYNVGLRAGWQTAMAPDLAAYYTKITGAKDNAAKEAALKEMQELSADNMPFIPYAQYPKNIAVKKGLQGVEFSNVYRLDLSKLAWAK